jgi:hypothetical protein
MRVAAKAALISAPEVTGQDRADAHHVSSPPRTAIDYNNPYGY